MTTLTVYRADTGAIASPAISDINAIIRELAKIDILVERWPVRALAKDADSKAVLNTYAPEIEQLNKQYNFVTVDAIRLMPNAPNAQEMREKFLSEHTHDDDEVRFFVEGSGSFYIRKDNLAYQIICTQGDLISVPRGVKHWFDTGSPPYFAVVRFFTNPKGWEAVFTGDDVARRVPLYEQAA
jgi:1,2-dihydroxy-3-keto-5-methylthiopentene dioxygenase